MRADSKRETGFYWVRFEGERIVAEYTFAFCNHRPHWHVPGSKRCFLNGEVCELLSEKLHFQRAHDGDTKQRMLPNQAPTTKENATGATA
jgi:hypothetical protein